ncbi:hypothetical protein N8I77_011691 [Diaporthe amygdali]|uniref:Uncharacterized protein n=1 Tax=Phomopsis amygdali TaxID=1214568 RepID=A0AAD9S385_PHOAM|nr:hypothetical protein N8I77_011691 [Diaporthe amygdali]
MVIANEELNQVAPHDIATFHDNGALLAPNVYGEMLIHTIVNMTPEFNVPEVLDKSKVTGAADQVIAYINTHFAQYIWPDIDELNTISSEKPAQDNPTPNCNIFTLAPYNLANDSLKDLKQLGNHYFNLGPGSRTCSQVRCREDSTGRRAAIWWCNDDLIGATAPAYELAELAELIIPTCVEFDIPSAYTRGQIFHKTYPWNAIVTSSDRCD